MAEASKLLSDYMKENPLSPNDPFKEAFEKFEGHELGREVLRLIKAKFFGKYIPGMR